MKPAASVSALKVQTALGDRFQVLEFDASTRTAEDAASAVGCSVAQIAKSLIFRGAESGRPVLVVASGAHRVEEKRVTENAMGQDVVELRWRLATLEEAKELVICWNARLT